MLTELRAAKEQIKVGDYVTVVKWVGVTDRSYVGNVLKVKAVDAPFYAVKDIRYERQSLISLHGDHVVLKKLSDDYVKAFLPDDAATSDK